MVISRRSGAALAAAVVLTLAAASACGANEPSPGTPTGSSAGGITVLAAASLTEAFTTIGKDFEARNSGQKVTFSFGSSATLATQITQGAPADVFAAASPATMKTVTDVGAAGNPRELRLQHAGDRGAEGKSASRSRGLADFGDQKRRIAICAPEVPCGAAAVKVFAAAKITPRPDTLEQDVKATLHKVAEDEVDAALVYRTDVISSPEDVDGITFPESAQAVNEYPIATLKESKNATTAQAFVDYVLSPEGQAVLTNAGFAKP